MSERRLPTAAPDGLIAAVLLSFLATAGMFYVNIMAALVSGLVEGLHFSAKEAGFVASANVYGAALGGLIAVFLVKRLTWRPVVIGLLVTLIALDLISTQIHSAQVLIGLRLLDGVTGGFLVGTAYSVVARTASPDRVFGMLLVVQFGLGGVGLMVLPQLVGLFGTPVLFLALALFSLVTLAMVPFLAAYPRRAPSAEATQTGTRRIAWGALSLALVATFLFQAGNMALGAYIFELGKSYGLTIQWMSPILGVAGWIGAVGSLLVVFFGSRFGRFVPLLIAFVLTVIGNFAFHWSDSQFAYAAANIGTSITWAFVVPYLLGMCAAFDETGQTAALAGFFSKMGLASGPLIGGYLITGNSYLLLINVSVLLLTLSGVLALFPARLLDRKRTIITAEPATIS